MRERLVKRLRDVLEDPEDGREEAAARACGASTSRENGGEEADATAEGNVDQAVQPSFQFSDFLLDAFQVAREIEQSMYFNEHWGWCGVVCFGVLIVCVSAHYVVVIVSHVRVWRFFWASGGGWMFRCSSRWV